MNLVDIKYQVSSQIKTMAAIPAPVVSIPAEWVDSGQMVWAALTSDRAKQIYGQLWAAIKWTARAVWSLTLVVIALVFLAIEAYQNRDAVKVAVVEKVRILRFQAVEQWLTLRKIGRLQVQQAIVLPVRELRIRFKVAAQTVLRGVEVE